MAGEPGARRTRQPRRLRGRERGHDQMPRRGNVRRRRRPGRTSRRWRDATTLKRMREREMARFRTEERVTFILQPTKVTCPWEPKLMAVQQIGYAAMLEQFHPTELIDYCVAGRDSRLHRRHGRRPPPAVGAAAGQRRLRVGRSWRPPRNAPRATSDPASRAHPSASIPAIIAQAAATMAAMYPGSLLARPGLRRGAQRAPRRRLLAGGARAHQHDVRGDRDHPRALHRQGRQA